MERLGSKNNCLLMRDSYQKHIYQYGCLQSVYNQLMYHCSHSARKCTTKETANAPRAASLRALQNESTFLSKLSISLMLCISAFNFYLRNLRKLSFLIETDCCKQHFRLFM